MSRRTEKNNRITQRIRGKSDCLEFYETLSKRGLDEVDVFFKKQKGILRLVIEFPKDPKLKVITVYGRVD